MAQTEFRIKDEDVNKVMEKFDTNKDNKMDFDEFCRLCQFNRNAVMMGVAMDALTVATYAKVFDPFIERATEPSNSNDMSDTAMRGVRVYVCVWGVVVVVVEQ